MSLAQGFPSTFSDTQKTNEVLHNLDNETKKIYNDVNAIMAADGHSHTGNGSDGALLSVLGLSGGTLTGVLNEHLGAPIASASTINLTTATGNFLHITGTTTITTVTLGAGMRREIVFDGILTLTHHAINNNLPSAANITTAVGDMASYYSDGTTVYCTKYARADGKAIVATEVVVASSAEAIIGTDNTKMITPLQLRNGLNASGTAPVYVCRAWVSFNGIGTVTIISSGNVSSITDNGIGDFTINFSTAMPHANYAYFGTTRDDSIPWLYVVNGHNSVNPTTTSLRIKVLAQSASTTTGSDNSVVNVCIFC